MNRAVGVGLVVGVVAFCVYLATLCPTIFAGDSGELATAAATLGIAHPPGYPLWTLGGRLAVLLLPGEAAFSLNLFSALCMAGAAALLAALLSVWSRQWLVPIGAGLAFAFSRGVWQSAVVTEVYALNLLLTVAALLAAVLARRDRPRLFLLAAYLIGLGVANHPLVLLVGLPVLALASVPRGAAGSITAGSFARWPGMAAVFLLGLTVYVYLPVRVDQGPQANWGELRSFGDILDHVLRAQYGGLGEASADASFGVRLRVFFEVVNGSVPVLFWILAALGVVGAARSGHARRAGLAVAFFALAGPATAAAIRYEDTFLDHSVVTVFFLPAVLALFLLVGLGLAAVRSWLDARLSAPSLGALCVGAAAALLPAAFQLGTQYRACDRSRSTFALDYADRVLRDLPADSWLFVKGDNACFALYYAQQVLGLRPDVTLVDRTMNLNVEAYGEEIAALSRVARRRAREAREMEMVFGDVDRPVFFTEETDALSFAGCRVVPSGYVTQLLRPGERAVAMQAGAESLAPIDTGDFLETHFAAATLYREGQWLVREGRDEVARERYDRAASLATEIPPILRNIGLARLELQDWDAAERMFRAALELEPDNEDALYNLAVLCSQLGRVNESIEWFARLDRLATDSPEVPLGHAVELLKVGRLAEAAAQAERGLQLAPELPSAVRLVEALRQGVRIGGEPGVLEAQRMLGPLTSDGTLQLAQRYLERGDWVRATELYREASNRTPDHAGAVYGLGYGLLQAGRYEEAGTAFRRVLELDPGSADGRNALAFILAQTGDSLDLAERLANEATELDPSRAAYWMDTLGWVRYRAGTLGPALEALQEAERTLPVDDRATRAENQYHIGSVLLGMNRPDAARASFQRSSELSAEGPWIPDLEARMRDLDAGDGSR